MTSLLDLIVLKISPKRSLMMVDTLPFLVHLLYTYLSPLDQLNLVRANICPTLNIQYHLTEFFDNVTGIPWSTISQLLESATAQVGGQTAALFFSPVWYRPLGLHLCRCIARAQ